jgi:hypothetical protein
VRFSEFLRTTVLLSAASATVLGLITVLSATREVQEGVVYLSVCWWLVASLLGLWLGRHAETSPPIARLLAGARAQTTLPELKPGATLANRLWPLFLMTIAGGVVGLFVPQVAAVAAGFGIVWALAWRRQEAAVLAIEHRDAARFYVDAGSVFEPMKLVRTPGFGG